MDYHGGKLYPRLERVATGPNMLDEIIQPMVKAGQ
jgi:hypothetical protein